MLCHSCKVHVEYGFVVKEYRFCSLTCLPKKVIVARNKKYVPLNIMQEIRKVDRTWQFKVGGEWQDAHVEPNVPILQPNWDGEGFA